jgi:hypothetical protein
MDFAGYIAAGYGISAAAIALYAWRVVRRGRELARALPPEEIRWR